MTAEAAVRRQVRIGSVNSSMDDNGAHSQRDAETHCSTVRSHLSLKHPDGVKSG